MRALYKFTILQKLKTSIKEHNYYTLCSCITVFATVCQIPVPVADMPATFTRNSEWISTNQIGIFLVTNCSCVVAYQEIMI